MSEKLLSVLYKDEHIAIINKPANIIIHKTSISNDATSLVDLLKEQFNPTPLPVHRLDRPVSGVLCCAYTKEGASALSLLFREGRIQKSYIALVRGHLRGTGEINRPLKGCKNPDLKEALSSYRSLALIELPIPTDKYKTSRFTLVEVKPHTGRYHQIRRHLAGIGYPIIGDTSHGDTHTNHLFEEKIGPKGLFLQAKSIEFLHPITKENLKVVSPFSPLFTQIVELMQIDLKCIY